MIRAPYAMKRSRLRNSALTRLAGLAISTGSKPCECMSCGRVWPISWVDAAPRSLRRSWINWLKPKWLFNRQLRRAADTGVDFDWLEGPCCYYGPYERNGE